MADAAYREADFADVLPGGNFVKSEIFLIGAKNRFSWEK